MYHKVSGHTYTPLPSNTTVNSEGYVVVNNKPLYIRTKVERGNYDKNELRALTFCQLTDEQKTLVWRLDEKFEDEYIECTEACDERTDKYLQSIRDNLCYIETVGGYEEALGDAGYSSVKCYV